MNALADLPSESFVAELADHLARLALRNPDKLQAIVQETIAALRDAAADARDRRRTLQSR
jgi:hypothetical protein